MGGVSANALGTVTIPTRKTPKIIGRSICLVTFYFDSVPISLITAIFYNKIITNGYCLDPHLPQNFAAGFSLAPQLSQNADVGLVSAGFGLGL